MKRQISNSAYYDVDDLAEDGVYFVHDDSDRPYDVRLAAKLFEELGLRPGDTLPEEMLRKCYLEPSEEKS